VKAGGVKQPDGAPAPGRKRFFKLSLLFLILGLLAKPMLVSTPLILLLMDFWPLNRCGGAGRNQSRLETAKYLLSEKWPFFFVSVVLGVITFFAQRAGGAIRSAPHLGAFSRIGDVMIGYLSYLEKIFWPQNLTFLYLRPEGVNLGLLLTAVLVLSGLSLLAVLNLRCRPYLLMGWLWFLGMLLPVSGLIPFGLQSVADRYTYLPSIGLFVMCVWGLAEFTTTAFRTPGRRLLPVAGVIAILCVSAGWSRHQLAYWENTQTLMEHALAIDPNNYIAHDNLGIYFSKMGRTRDALEQYRLERELDSKLAHPPGETSRTNVTPPPVISR
jgi:hypothetical protein